MNFTELMEIADVMKISGKALAVELDNRGFTIEQLKEALDEVVSVIHQVMEAVKKTANDIIDGLILATANKPKHYQLYKHAKKLRTRKKYRRMLWRETIINLTGGVTA